MQKGIIGITAEGQTHGDATNPNLVQGKSHGEREVRVPEKLVKQSEGVKAIVSLQAVKKI